MYKRFAKELKKTKEESSSESESIDAPIDDLFALSDSDHGSDSSAHDSANSGEEIDAPNDRDDVLETGVLTIDELEAGDEAVPRKPKRGEVLLYQCSICPEKELFNLRDVKEHIASKFHKNREALLVKHGIFVPGETDMDAPMEDAPAKKPRVRKEKTQPKQNMDVDGDKKPKKRTRDEVLSESSASDSEDVVVPKGTSKSVVEHSKKSEKTAPAAKKLKDAKGDAVKVPQQNPPRKTESEEQKAARYAAKREFKLQKQATQKEERKKVKEEKKKNQPKESKGAASSTPSKKSEQFAPSKGTPVSSGSKKTTKSTESKSPKARVGK